MSFLRTYGTTVGPVGIPMHDDQAFALDAIFKQLPAEDQRLRKAAIPSALRYLASGLNDAHFLHNPLVGCVIDPRIFRTTESFTLKMSHAQVGDGHQSKPSNNLERRSRKPNEALRITGLT